MSNIKNVFYLQQFVFSDLISPRGVFWSRGAVPEPCREGGSTCLLRRACAIAADIQGKHSALLQPDCPGAGALTASTNGYNSPRPSALKEIRKDLSEASRERDKEGRAASLSLLRLMSPFLRPKHVCC